MDGSRRKATGLKTCWPHTFMLIGPPIPPSPSAWLKCAPKTQRIENAELSDSDAREVLNGHTNRAAPFSNRKTFRTTPRPAPHVNETGRPGGTGIVDILIEA